MTSRDDYALKAGETVMALLAKNIRPRDICTRDAFRERGDHRCRDGRIDQRSFASARHGA